MYMPLTLIKVYNIKYIDRITMRFGKIIALFAASTPILASPILMSPEPPLYQIIRGEYEDKIRRYSPPEKIFNVFAQKNSKEQWVLNLVQMLKTICFYNYSESSSEHIVDFDPIFIKKFLGKDDEFEIYDYFNFARFLVYPDEKIIQFMNNQQNSQCSKEMFIQLMMNHICKDYDAFIRPSVGIQSRNFNPKKEDFILSINRTANSFFKDKSLYSVRQIMEFRDEMIREIYVFEFRSYNIKEKEIDGVEFARSIVKYTSHNSKRKLLRRSNSIHEFIEPIKINEKEYVDFHTHLHLNEKTIAEHLKVKGVINKKEMRELFSPNDHSRITDKQLEIFFQLLDIDNSGFIDKNEILGVIEDLGYYWNVKSGDMSLRQMLEIKFTNLRNKLNKIQEIVMEQ